jgi:hypothetical protein
MTNERTSTAKTDQSLDPKLAECELKAVARGYETERVCDETGVWLRVWNTIGYGTYSVSAWSDCSKVASVYTDPRHPDMLGVLTAKCELMLKTVFEVA